MSTSPARQPSPRPKGPAPFLRDGIAVFDKAIPDGRGGTKQIYDISDERRKLKYIACPAVVLGYRLSRPEVADLYLGHTLYVKAPKTSGSGTYELALGATGVVETLSERLNPQTGKPYVNRRLNIVSGFPLRSRASGETGEEDRNPAPIEAFIVAQTQDGPRDVKFYRFAGPKADPFKLELGDCYRLLERVQFVRDGWEVSLEGIKELPDPKNPARVYKTATVKARQLSAEELKGLPRAAEGGS